GRRPPTCCLGWRHRWRLCRSCRWCSRATPVRWWSWWPGGCRPTWPVSGRGGRWALARLGLALEVEDPLDDGDDRTNEDDAEGELEGRDADARPGEDDPERDYHEPDLARDASE